MFYIGICKEKGNCVKEEHCFGYAIYRIFTNPEDRQEFIEWFYSGNWIKTENGDDYYEKKTI